MPPGLRAVKLGYVDPFTRRRVEIRAPIEGFMHEYGFTPSLEQLGKPPAPAGPPPTPPAKRPGSKQDSGRP
jgi:hypothetical protein